VQARRLPQRLIARTEAWRLAPAVPAGALALVLAVTGAGPLRDALGGIGDGAPTALPATLPADPHHPGTGLLQALTPPAASPHASPHTSPHTSARGTPPLAE
ncbi:hypothetical protein, partial [Rhodobaculum claviforme]